jgi:ubiquinone/menaquinone biosynthesis C-methylase UbiE
VSRRQIIRWMDQRLYPAYENNWDNRMFRQEILRLLNRNSHVLDLGAGAGIVEQMNFRGKAARICGVDPDERVLSNPYLDDARVGVSEQIPYPDRSFDLVFANNVLEHLPDPKRTFKEVARLFLPRRPTNVTTCLS